MVFEQFENLPVWKAAADLLVDLYAFSRKAPVRDLDEIPQQLRQSALKISSRIAEGCEQGETATLERCLQEARAASGEVRSLLAIIKRMPGTSSIDSEVSLLLADVESICRQLRGWTVSLQESRTPRYQPETSHNRITQHQCSEEFVRRLKEANDRLEREQAAKRRGA